MQPVKYSFIFKCFSFFPKLILSNKDLSIITDELWPHPFLNHYYTAVSHYTSLQKDHEDQLRAVSGSLTHRFRYKFQFQSSIDTHCSLSVPIQTGTFNYIHHCPYFTSAFSRVSNLTCYTPLKH